MCLCFDFRSSGKISAGSDQQQCSPTETQTAAEDRGLPEERRSAAGRGGGRRGERVPVTVTSPGQRQM